MPNTRHQPAFSLIEILVAISIVGVLLALVVVGASRFRVQAQIEQTRVLLQQLAGVETEYRAQSAGKYPSDDPDDKPSGAPAAINTSIEWFIYQADRFPAVREMMTRTLNQTYYTAPDGTTPGSLVDSWGNPIEYRAGSNGQTKTDVAQDVGGATEVTFPLNSTPFFASAGPDGKWGSYGLSNGGADVNQPNDDGARDNLYSFKLD